ncbi:MAG TPA: ABC transporter ATP-binding protein [Vicinamibacterales bacterium]
MSGPLAVAVDRVSKRFLISRRRGAGLKERALGALSRERTDHEVLWALRDVSFDIREGTTCGVVGPNGCGKSTLLQLVAGILHPDGGSIRTRGRITSLLELGAGFSPELTGRENVFLNASLHGVTREVVQARFDAIVAFAELERFIDMPVRTYSSGMYVRLGFAVAVHLDPEIVLVDEAFAVGDERFQRKCLHTIREFQREGRTIVLVSHDLILVEQLCSQAVLLNYGELVAQGNPADVIGRYHELNLSRGAPGSGHRWGSGPVEITGLEVLVDGAPAPVVRTRQPVTFRLRYRCSEPVDQPAFGLAIHRDDGVHLTGPNTKMSGFDVGRIEGEGTLDYVVERLPLLPGRYYLSAAVYDHDLITPFDHRDRFVPLVVVEGGTAERFGLVELPATWRMNDRRPELHG